MARAEMILLASSLLLLALSFLRCGTLVYASEEVESPTCSWEDDTDGCNDENDASAVSPRVPPDCTVVLAPSSLHGYGLFTLTDFRRGQPVLPGDVVLHLSQHLLAQQASPFAATHYWWSSSETAGWSDGPAAVAPGVGMAANGDPHHASVLPAVPAVDEAGLTRTASPGAGASTAYHNWTWYIQSPVVSAGSELLVHYGPQWFAERAFPTEAQPLPATVPVDELRRTGWCVDQFRSGQSALRDAGRGAFARRFLPEGAVVAPVPVLTIQRSVLLRNKKRRTASHELLLNYCWGHPESSLLLYSYGPLVNLINHSGGKRANVRLQWVDNLQNVSIAQALTRPFLLELVATRPIRKGEEVVLDYGLPWIEAWLRHVKTWRPVDTKEQYAPSYVMNDAIQVLRTEDELKNHPYPPNVYTSCYFRVDLPKDTASTTQKQDDDDTTTAVRWTMQRGVFTPRHLRPCRILQRHETDNQLYFTVQLRNRPGLDPLPGSRVHIITHVPRHAVTFSDRPYTTDAYLPSAFRYPMGNVEYPEQWKDLSSSSSSQRDDATAAAY